MKNFIKNVRESVQDFAWTIRTFPKEVRRFVSDTTGPYAPEVSDVDRRLGDIAIGMAACLGTLIVGALLICAVDVIV